MPDIIIKPHDSVYNVIGCDLNVAADLHEYFCFDTPNSFWAKRNRPGWDGKIRLFNKKTHKLYAGLNQRLEAFARDRNLTVHYDYKIPGTKLTIIKAREFIKTLSLPEKYGERHYQLDTFVHAVRNHRRLLLGPTGSGKSLIIYQLLRWLEGTKTLIIVPTLNILHQMFNDFKDYGFNSPENIHLISSGADKDTEHIIYCSTWQSIYDMPKEYFQQFGMVIVDEVHGADAKSIKGIMEKLTNCPYRFGFTGTLKDTLCHRLVLEGLFGPIYQAATTSELIDAKYLSDLMIKCIILQYEPEVCKSVRGLDYSGEINFLITLERRNKFIKNLALSLEGNVLVLFRMIDHGKELWKLIKEKAGYHPVYLIYGATPGEEREQIRQILHKEKNAILIGSYGCVSTGINIPSLKHIILASPYKSRIKVLQSIGRGLRRTADKNKLIVYDIADDLSHKKHQNFTLRHFVERVKLYNEERFQYKTYRIQI